MKITLLFATVAAAALACAGSGMATSVPAVLVVDDDGGQCAADFDSIQAAVDAAPARSVIRVCPGVYSENVLIEKTLTLRGQVGAVDEQDCFAEAPAVLSPELYAIVDPPGTTVAFTLAARHVELAGLVVGGSSSGVVARDVASDGTTASGYRIHHNLLRLNTVGIEFASDGETPSRFDHNCMRENGWGLAAESGALRNARIDHNRTFRTRNYAFQAAPGIVENVTLDHNQSRLDDSGYLVWNSKRSRITHNTLDTIRVGITVGNGVTSREPTADLEISGNTLVNSPGGQGLTGLGFASAPTGVRSTRVLVKDNVISGMRLRGIAIGGPPGTPAGSLVDAEFTGNVMNDNLQHGILLRGGNTAITMRGNIAHGNGRFGIHAECGLVGGVSVCPTGNTFIGNSMLGNGWAPPVPGINWADARDEARDTNTWTSNLCATDFPVGTICAMH